MQELPIFVAGLVVGLVLAALAQLVRSRSVRDVGEPPTTPRGGRQPDGLQPLIDSGPDTPVSPGSGLTVDGRGVHLRKTSVVHRIEAKVEPGGILTIVVDGQTYHRLEDLPDAAMRERVRAIFAGLPADVQDPALHEKVVAELEDAGITGQG